MKTSSEQHNTATLDLQRYSLHGNTMGTRYSAVFFDAPGVEESAIAASLFGAVDVVDRQMSTWQADSDLSRLNRAPEHLWQELPEALICVLTAALRISRQSGGAFDIGVGDLVNAWGFGPSAQQINEHQINVLKTQKRWFATDALDIDAAQCRVRKRAPITLDLSGIAKGYGVDQLAHCLDTFGITRYLVGIDGEMRARGVKPDGRPWSIAIEKPVRDRREVMGVMELGDAAIATSGDYRHWTRFQGKDYAHTMNTALRGPSCNRLAAVSVVASSCMLADAWATALLVLGEEAGIELAQARGMDALFVLHDGDGFREASIIAGQHL